MVIPSFLSKKETIFEGFSESYLRTSRPKEASGSKKVFTTKNRKKYETMWYYLGKKQHKFLLFFHQSPWLIKTLIFLFFLRKMSQNRWVFNSKYSHGFFLSHPYLKTIVNREEVGKSTGNNHGPLSIQLPQKLVRTTGITGPYCLKMKIYSKKLSQFQFYFLGLLETSPMSK